MKFRFVFSGPDDGDGDAIGMQLERASWELLYGEQAGHLIRRQQAPNGCYKPIPLTNFTARIVSELIVDDGAEQQRHFVLEAELARQKRIFTVPASDFGKMGWVLRQLGPQAIIYPGQQQHARAAIQSLSHEIRCEHIFNHTGWRQHDGEWIYLHGAGAIGRNGAVPDVKVRLDGLRHYELGVAADPAGLVGALRASLRLLEVAPDHISFPLLAAVHRAPLGSADFSLFLTGKTGVFKSALSALAQQHFGPKMDAVALPGNFSSTANSLELKAFQAKDALLVVDDFAPSGSARDGELQATAERLFRAAGNRQGRSRMGPDGRLLAEKPPRALILATGEEVPSAHSIRARLLIVELAPGDVDRKVLSECQQAAADGRLAVALGGFVQWIAGRYEPVQQELQNRVLALRSQHGNGGPHARTSAMIAELQAGVELFLRFAAECGAIPAKEKDLLAERSRQALLNVAAAQAKFQAASDPALRFLALLRAALASGAAHVADKTGCAPGQPALWGWRKDGGDWVPMGLRIGWLSGDDLFLEPAMSYRAAQQAAGCERMPISEQTLRRRLVDMGLLASIDQRRETLKVRRTIEGVPREVLHLNAREVADSR